MIVSSLLLPSKSEAKIVVGVLDWLLFWFWDQCMLVELMISPSVLTKHCSGGLGKQKYRINTSQSSQQQDYLWHRWCLLSNAYVLSYILVILQRLGWNCGALSGKIFHYCLELKMYFHILEWRFELPLNCLLQDRTLIRGRKRNIKCLMGKAEQPNSICDVAPKCFSTAENVFNMWQHKHNLLHLSFSLLWHFILHIKYLTRISICLMLRILEDDLDLYIKNTQLFLSANILS